MIISLHAEKTSNKVQYTFMIKFFPESRHRGNLLQHIKGPQDKPTGNRHSGKKLKAFPLRPGIRLRMFTLITFIQHTHLYISISIFRIFCSVAITISKLQFDRRRKKIQQHSINLFTNYRHPLCRGPFPTHTASMCEAIMQEMLM